MSGCTHQGEKVNLGESPNFTQASAPQRVLLRLDCGSGGYQFRRYCTACWCDLEGAIPHRVAQAELRGSPPVDGDLGLLHSARDAFAQFDRRTRELFP